MGNFDGDIKVWWEKTEDKMAIKNGDGDKILLTQNEAINLYRILNKRLSIKNKIDIKIHGNKRLGKLLI